MPAVYPRKRNQRRPSYLPTAVAERLSKPVLPSDTISDWDRRRLEARGIDLGVIDAMSIDVVRVNMRLPYPPVPTTPLETYRPAKT